MIKLIVSDIDGTLLNEGENYLNPELVDVILKLRKKGLQFAAASGRHWSSVEEAFEAIKEKIFYLCDNGSYVGCHGRNLFLTPIKREDALAIIREARDNRGMDLMVSCPDTVYLDTDNELFTSWLTDGYKLKLKKVEDITKVDEEILKIAAYVESDIDAQDAELKVLFAGKAKLAISGDAWMDFMNPDVNKGQAVKLLQESLGISPMETMVFGDQLNDLEMLDQAYYSFAVGNARPEVRKAARFQADTNTNNGVLKVLRQLL